MAGFLAYIMPVDQGAHPDNSLPGQPPGIWPGGKPEHPIVLPIPPDSIWPGVPAHPIYIPVYPAHPIVIPPGSLAPGVPAHPIYLPPVIWPSPGHPAHPIVLPPGIIDGTHPEHPIYLPPTVWPPLDPPTIWPSPGGPSQGPGFPTPPIYLPPQVPPEMKPPATPPAGQVTPVPPPEGSDGWPATDIAQPDYVVLQYPGYGPVYVGKPVESAPTPTGRRG